MRVLRDVRYGASVCWCWGLCLHSLVPSPLLYCYAMSGTDLLQCYVMSGTDLLYCYAMSGTEQAYGGICLCACDVMSGTEIAYGGTSWRRLTGKSPMRLRSVLT
eukprot:2566100-Rhodomonas_salina.1